MQRLYYRHGKCRSTTDSDPSNSAILCFSLLLGTVIMTVTTLAELPPELISRIVDMLMGANPDVFAGERHRPDSLILNKRELGRCSLVCQYWARILRKKIFRTLTITSRTEAETLLSFVTQPHVHKHSIARLIRGLTLKQDLHDYPWIHRILFSTRHIVGLANISITVEADAARSTQARPLRTILPQLPRTLPPSTLLVPHVTYCTIRNTTFAHVGDINAILRSLLMATSDDWVRRSSIGSASPHSWRFERIAVADASFSFPTRPITFRRSAHLTVDSCANPCVFLRAVVHTGRRTARPESDTYWTPYALPGAMEVFEEIAGLTIFNCTHNIHESGDSGSPKITTLCHCCQSCSFTLSKGTEEGNPEDGFRVSTHRAGRRCSTIGLDDVEVVFSSAGTLQEIIVILGDQAAAVTAAPWAELDDLLMKRAHGLLKFGIKFTNRGRADKPVETVVAVGRISLAMPHMQRLGKLWTFGSDYQRWVRLGAESSPDSLAQTAE